MLIDAGANVNVTDTYGTTPLMSVTRNNLEEDKRHIEKYVELLLDAGAKWDGADGMVMDNCILRYDWASVAHLVEHGAILNEEQKAALVEVASSKVLKRIEAIRKAFVQKQQKQDQEQRCQQNEAKEGKEERSRALLDTQDKSTEKEVKESKLAEKERLPVSMPTFTATDVIGGTKDVPVASVKEKAVIPQSQSINAPPAKGSNEPSADVPRIKKECAKVGRKLSHPPGIQQRQHKQEQMQGSLTIQQETVPMEVYLKLKAEYEKEFELVEEYSRMLSSEEEHTYRALIRVSELEKEVNILRSENSALKDTVSDLKKQAQVHFAQQVQSQYFQLPQVNMQSFFHQEPLPQFNNSFAHHPSDLNFPRNIYGNNSNGNSSDGIAGMHFDFRRSQNNDDNSSRGGAMTTLLDFDFDDDDDDALANYNNNNNNNSKASSSAFP